MQVIDVLDERIIDLHTHAHSKDEVLTYLAQKLKNAGYLEDVDDFLKDIYHRECEGITGIGNYIAIPHGKSSSVKRVGIAIAKLEHEIPWETLDEKGVRFVFLFAVSADQTYASNHMRLLADIARHLGNDDAVESLLKVQSMEELKDVFS